MKYVYKILDLLRSDPDFTVVTAIALLCLFLGVALA